MADDNEKKSNMIFVGQAWKRKTRNQEDMLTGEIKFKVIILPNKKHKPGDNLPNVNVFFAPADREKKEGKKDSENPDDII